MIYSAPSENVTVPLGQTTLVDFNCNAGGIFVHWVINGTRGVHGLSHENMTMFEERGVTFYPTIRALLGINISIGIDVTTARNNNTQIYCQSTGATGTENSTTITLTIAGTDDRYKS